MRVWSLENVEFRILAFEPQFMFDDEAEGLSEIADESIGFFAGDDEQQ